MADRRADRRGVPLACRSINGVDTAAVDATRIRPWSSVGNDEPTAGPR
ncbi:hypothetical protein ACFYOT_31675 [Saccharothrix saharensis]